jgi:glycosyltransferase involved in cell wall biosynthesis
MVKEIILVSSHRVSESLGGVEKYVVSLSAWCSNKGFNVTVLSRTLALMPVRVTRGPIHESENQEPRIVKTVELPFVIYYFGLSLFSLVLFLTLLKIVKDSRKKGDQPIVLHSQDLNFAAIPTVFVSKITKVQSIVHQHGPYIQLLSSKNVAVIEQAINKLVVKLADKIVVTDRYTQEYLTRIGAIKEKVQVLPACLKTELFRSSSNSLNNTARFEIGYVGRLSPEKNVETLLLGFKLFKESIKSQTRLIVIGDGQSRNKLQLLTSELGLQDAVTFKGFIVDVKPYLNSFDVFVLPSKVEGTPISLLEAMASGKAIIASNLPSISEIVADGKEALLFNHFDDKQLASLLYSLYMDMPLRNLLSINAQRKVIAYDVDVVFSSLVQTYQNRAFKKVKTEI